jgi:Domain of unknown function (DUF4337)
LNPSDKKESKQIMSGAHQNMEHAEHAAHSGSHQGGHNKLFGVTMALIGVLIAFCSAMVGSERNELTRTMIEQTQAHSDYTAASTKLRLIMIEIEKQHARIASARDPQGGFSPVPRFIKLADDYTKERNLAKTWADTYRPLVDGHFDAAEGYERAQLIAEIGIVLASLGVLLSSKPAWMLSVIMSVICIFQLGRTFIHTSNVVRTSHEKIHHAEEAYIELRKSHGGDNDDEKAIQRLDADGSIRAAIAERAKNREAAESHPEEAKK